MLSRISCCTRSGPLYQSVSTLRSAARQTVTRSSTRNEVVKDWHYYGKLLLGGSALVGGVAICTVGMKPEVLGDVSALSRSMVWPEHVRARIRNTYLWFTVGLAGTAGAAVLGSRSIALQSKMGAHPFITMIGLIAVTMALNTAQRALPMEPSNYLTKGALAAGLYGVIGMVLGPICYVQGPILVKAAAYTGALVAGLSLAAVTAPSEKFLYMSGPLMMGLGGVAVACLATPFLPATGLLGGGMHVIAVYGGVVVFSGFMLYDTQRVIRDAELTPYHQSHDPISASVGIYMNTINIFIRMVMILSGNKRK